MDVDKIPGLALGPRKILFLALASLLIYLALFALNLVSTNRQLAELGRLRATRESAANLRATLSRFVLDDIRLGNRRGMTLEQVQEVKQSAEETAQHLARDLQDMETFLGTEGRDLAHIQGRLVHLRILSARRINLLNAIYDSKGLLSAFVTARGAADDAFTAVSEIVPIPTRDFLAAKSSQNEFLAGVSPTAADSARAHLHAYVTAAARFPGLSQGQRHKLETTATVYLNAFTQLSEALTAAEEIRDEIQDTWTELLPTIDRVTDAVTNQAREQSDRVRMRTRNIEIASALLALFTALGFAGVTLSAYRFAAERDRRLKESNARFRDLAFASSDIFMEADADGRILLLEGQQDDWAQEYATRAVGRFIGPSMKVFGLTPASATSLDTVLAARQPFRDFEYHLRHPRTGEGAWHSISGMPTFDKKGVFTGFRFAMRNITAHRQLIAERTVAESRLSAIIQNLPLALFRIEWTGVESRLAFVSANIVHVIGLSPEDLGKQWNSGDYGFILEADRENFKQEIWAELAEGSAHVSRARVRLPDGSIRWIQQVIQTTTSSSINGVTRAIEGLWIDVTEEENRLQRLRDFEQAINTSNQAFFIADAGTMAITYYSAGYARLFGYPTDRVLPGIIAGQSGRPIGQRRKDLIDEIDREAAGPEGWRGEFSWQLKDGTIQHFMGHARAIPNDRRVVVLTEISDRVAQEKQLLAITTAVENASDGVVLFKENNGPILYANAAIRRMFRLPDDVKIEGRYIADFLPDRQGADQARAEGEAVIAASGVWQSQMDAMRADGTPISVLLRGTRLPDQRVVVMMTDITDRIAKEAEEQELRRRLADAQRLEAIGSLAGGIAHDFNNIIGAARGFADLLVADLPEGEPRHYAERIVATCRRATSLVREIMAFSRVKDEEHNVIDITDSINEAGDILVGRNGKNLRLQVENVADSCQVRGNYSQISQVISNIVINAADATPDSGGKVALIARCLRHNQDRLSDAEWHAPTRQTASGRRMHIVTQGSLKAHQDYLSLRVEDNGTGMTERVLGRIFEPFFTTKEKIRGTGLGLAVVASIIDAHEGAIRVETTAGGGTAFEVYLPLSDEAAHARHRISSVEELQDVADIRGHERILIVDDESDIADALSIALSRLGYETAPLYDSKEALDIFNEDPSAWDVIISDQSMPKMRGVQLIRKMKLVRPDMRTIVCTGHSDALTAERAAAEGIDAFFNKPIAAEALARAIRQILTAPIA